MTRPLSNDLRQRVIAAVDGGMSRRAAAERFGIAPSTAVRWAQQWRETASVEPRPRGGDHRSHRIEAHAEEILGLVDDRPDMTLAEIAARLEGAHGLRVALSTVWRFFERHGITLKKKPHTPASKSGLTSLVGAGPGSRPSLTSIPSAWCSSTRPAPRPRWPGAMAARCVAPAAAPRSRTGIGRRPPSSARSGSKA